jgi:hypothetical protein
MIQKDFSGRGAEGGDYGAAIDRVGGAKLAAPSDQAMKLPQAASVLCMEP